jgi:putative tricarboxylic transport membrane protein
MMFVKNPDVVWTIIASMYIGNTVLLVLNLPLITIWARFATVPYKYLGPVILAICIIGSYSVRNTIFDVWSMLVFGVIGFLMNIRGWPVPPMILGFILGPMFELYLRQSLQMSSGSFGIFFTRPISLGFLLLTVVLLIITQVLFKRTPERFISQDAMRK